VVFCRLFCLAYLVAYAAGIFCHRCAGELDARENSVFLDWLGKADQGGRRDVSWYYRDPAMISDWRAVWIEQPSQPEHGVGGPSAREKTC